MHVSENQFEISVERAFFNSSCLFPNCQNFLVVLKRSVPLLNNYLIFGYVMNNAKINHS